MLYFIPFVDSGGFSSHEIARGSNTKSLTGLYLNAYIQGYLQSLRDSLEQAFPRRFKGLIVTSSDRTEYNAEVAGSASNSHHIWRLEPDGKLHAAVDIKPIGITLEELMWHVSKNCKGEIYVNWDQGIVHIAPVPMENERFQKKDGKYSAWGK